MQMGSSEAWWKLMDHPKLPKGKTVAVVVLDGWGEAKPDEYNCIHIAETPTMDSLKKVCYFLPVHCTCWMVLKRSTLTRLDICLK